MTEDYTTDNKRTILSNIIIINKLYAYNLQYSTEISTAKRVYARFDLYPLCVIYHMTVIQSFKFKP